MIFGIEALDTTANVFVEMVEPIRVENVPDLVTKEEIVAVEFICALLIAKVLLWSVDVITLGVLTNPAINVVVLIVGEANMFVL